MVVALYLLATSKRDRYALHLVGAAGVAGAVVELRGARRLVVGVSLGVLDGAAVLEIRRDAGRPESVAAGEMASFRPRLSSPPY